MLLLVDRMSTDPDDRTEGAVTVSTLTLLIRRLGGDGGALALERTHSAVLGFAPPGTSKDMLVDPERSDISLNRK